MKKFLLISILFLISFSLKSQKVKVQVVKMEHTVGNDWEVMDDEFPYTPAVTPDVANPINTLPVDALAVNCPELANIAVLGGIVIDAFPAYVI